jgi:hypothetical protein
MVFKAASVVMAPDGDPEKHRTPIKTSKLELTVVVCELFNYDQAVSVCKDLVQNEGVQSLTLCPGFTHEGITKVVNALGEGVAINMSRGDVPDTIITGEILRKKGWFPVFCIS